MATVNPTDIKQFKTAAAFRQWLDRNHASCEGIWLRFYRKKSGVSSVRYAEALDEALCYGWIDGQAKPFDDKSWLQRYTPRRKKSIWSKRNTEHIARLTKEGKMEPAGLAQVEAAKADGRWDNAYASPRSMELPKEFLAAVAKNKKAAKFLKTLNRSNLYAIGWRIHTAKKPETRDKRVKEFISMLARGETFHPQKKPKK